MIRSKLKPEGLTHMTKFSKITTATLAIIMSLNALNASAQGTTQSSQTAQSPVVTSAPVAASARHAINTKGTGGNLVSERRSVGFDIKMAKRVDAIMIPGPLVTQPAPIPTAAPMSTTPEWPCGPVAWDSNNVAIPNSTSC
jgi:hypothetical protein